MVEARRSRQLAKVIDGSLPRPGLALQVLRRIVQFAPTGRKFFSVAIMLRKTLAPTERIALPEGLRWALAGPDEIAWLDAHPEATSRTAYQRRQDRGDSCICLKNGSEIVAYRWITRATGCLFCGFGSHYEIRFLTLKPNQAFLYDLYVYEKHRRRGYGTLLLQVIFEFLQDKDVDDVFCVADPDNLSVLRVELRLGFEPVRMAYGVRIRQWSAMIFGPETDQRLQQWAGELAARTDSR